MSDQDSTNNGVTSDNSSSSTTENTEPSVIHQLSSSIHLPSSRQQLPTAIVAPTEINSTQRGNGNGQNWQNTTTTTGVGADVIPPSTSSVENVRNATAGGDADNITRSLMQQVEDDSKRYCWVCFATDEDDLTAAWVKPCRCRGTTKWVHQACIQRWIDEKQKGNATMKVSCPQCNTEYYIYYPTQGSLVVIMDSVDTLISRVCPFVAAGIVVGSIYWTAVTYGAVTLMQVAGHKEGLAVMERADPLILLVGLPTIPIMLILGKMVRWENYALRLIRNHSCKIPLLRHILPSPQPPATLERSVSQDLPPLSDPVSATRILCGALLLPTVATLLGKALFENVTSNLKRSVLGGMAFITIKGVLRIYHKQQQHVRQTERKIMDFREPPPLPSGSVASSAAPSISSTAAQANTTDQASSTTEEEWGARD
jgi:E3 ubiquitin-protein ligase MARCH5